MVNFRTASLLSVLLSCLASVGMMSWPAHRAEASQAGSVPRPAPTLQMAWTLGSRLSLAAVLHDRAASAEQVNKVLAQASAVGKAMGVDVPPLPARTGSTAEHSAELLAYLLHKAGGPIARVLSDKHSQAHSDLFELAVKSNILLMMYAPGESSAVTIVNVIERNGPRAKLPVVLWKPVVDLVRGSATYQEVRDAVFKMHTDIAAHLAPM